MDNLVTDQTFDKRNFKDHPLVKGEYEYCSFTGCDFSNADLANVKFVGCTFSDCNLSNATCNKTALRSVKFKDSKMLGLRFDKCDKFGLDIYMDNCTLNYSSFYQTKLIKTTFKNSSLQEVDFTECDLTGSVFENCDLVRARFENTIIEKADFRTAYNYSIDLEINKIKKARFSHAGIAGLLDKYDISID